MIETWSEVTSLYNSLNHASRGAKNLSIWGEIFASAYVLNRTQANIMWQEIIDLNVPKDITFAKYFVAQIFNKIVEHLPLRDAVEFLHMNPARLPLLYANPYNGCAFFDYCILGYHIIKNDMDAVADFLNMRNKNNTEDKEIQNSERICSTFFEVVRKLESYSENSWHQQYTESSPKLAQSVYEWCDRAFPNSYMAQLARLHYLVLTKTTESDPVRIVKLLSLCEEHNTSLFTDLLYMHRDIIPKKEIKELLINYCQKHNSLPMEILDDDSQEEKAKARWYRRYFFDTEAISRSILLRTRGWLRDSEELYFDNLAKKGAWETWVSILARMILAGDASLSRSCISYVSACVRNAKPPKVSHYGFFTLTFSSGNENSVYFKFNDKQKVEFAKAIAMMCYALRNHPERNELCDDALEFIHEIPAINEAMPRLRTARDLQELGGRLVADKPSVIADLEAGAAEKEAEIQAEKARKEAELQHRATHMYECLLGSSPYKVKQSAFMKMPEIADHFEKIVNIAIANLAIYLKRKNIDIVPFVCNTSGVCSVHLTDEDGNIVRDTSMIVPRSDEDFSEYFLRYAEALFREKVNYPRVDFPAVPSINQNAKYYSFPNGSKGYYRCVYEADQPSLVKHDPNIYTQIQKATSEAVNQYFEERPMKLMSLKAACEFKPKKPIVEEIEDLINSGTEPQKTLDAVFNAFRNTVPTSKKTKPNVTASLAWDYWVLNAKQTNIKYTDFAECFVYAKWDWAQKKALAIGNYAAAFDYLTRYYSVFSKRLRKDDEQRIKNCVVVAMYATDALCRALNIDPKELFLGQWKEAPWTAFSNSTRINIPIARTISNVGDVVVYDTRNGAVCGTYEHTDAQTTIIRYILKLVETTFLDMFSLQRKNSSIEKIDGLFTYEGYDEFVALLPKVIITATTCASACEADLVIDSTVPELEVSTTYHANKVTQAIAVTTKPDVDAIVQQAFRVCYAMDMPLNAQVKKTYKSIEIDLERQTYRDFLCTEPVSDIPVIQEQNKQILTRFYQLYDSYCDQMQQIFDMPIEYDPAFSYAASKLRKSGGGFVGKELYQIPQILNDGKDFGQWIVRIEQGEIIFPDFQPYVPLLYYFIINERLFADRKDMGLVVMCKLWNHYYDDMPAQDISLILGWIKDYWMIHCQDISLEDFKRLFNRKVVFLNEPSVDILNCNTVLEYYNEICFYRVLHGKLVTKGHRPIFEAAFEAVNKKLAAVWAEYGLSYESMLYQAAGKSTYVYLRAIVSRDIQYQLVSQSLKREISTDESYIINENEKTLRLQWEFITQRYDTAFIKAFMEYTLKLTEYRLRMWLGYMASDSFNVDASSIYRFEQKDPIIRKLLLDNQDAGRIERIIYETVAEVCEAKAIVQKGHYEPFAVFHGSHDYTSDDLLAEEEKTDYEGIDPNQRITGKSLEEARQVLLRNQGKLVIEDEEDKPETAPEPTAVSFDPMELKLLRILIYSNNVAFELQNLILQNIIPSVLITKINEKAMDLIGDVLIDEEQSPPSIYEDYVEIIQEVLEANE